MANLLVLPSSPELDEEFKEQKCFQALERDFPGCRDIFKAILQTKANPNDFGILSHPSKPLILYQTRNLAKHVHKPTISLKNLTLLVDKIIKSENIFFLLHPGTKIINKASYKELIKTIETAKNINLIGPSFPLSTKGAYEFIKDSYAKKPSSANVPPPPKRPKQPSSANVPPKPE